MSDPDAEEMYITGRAGTGKTTILGDIVAWLIEEDIPYVVCAYTHKACNVLRSKLPKDANVETLCKFLKKRPGVNVEASKVKHVDIMMQMGQPDSPKVILIDEFSQVGEKDFESLKELVDFDEDTDEVSLKVVWIGETIQLPPVGDAEVIFPSGDYNYRLTKRFRQPDGNKLADTIDDLAAFIEGRKKPHYLEPNANFIRNSDIVANYIADDCEDKVLLAYTNKRVQHLNFSIEGKAAPDEYDRVFSPSTRQQYNYISKVTRVPYLDRAFGEPLEYGSKYRTLENLLYMEGIEFCHVTDEEGSDYFFAYVFGHYDYKVMLEDLKLIAVQSNQDIEREFNVKPAAWARQNSSHPLARARSIAWAKFLSFNQNVICLDFIHATTVHKSQGSTFTNVYVDDDDLSICADRDMNLYLRLRYVAYSRASNKVESNQ